MKLRTAYSDEKSFVSMYQESIEVKPFQIIVWVGISLDRHLESIPWFPTILDTGNNHNFAISPKHLSNWAKIQPKSLEPIKMMRMNKVAVPLVRAHLWLRTDSEPFELRCDDGIGISAASGFRLPILGLRALTKSKLQVQIDGDTRRVLIRTPPPWYWPF